MNGTELKRFRLGLGYESAQQLAEVSGYKAQTIAVMECGSRNVSKKIEDFLMQELKARIDNGSDSFINMVLKLHNRLFE